MMKFILVALLVIAATFAMAGPHDDCDFTAAVDACSNRIATAGRCDYFQCLVSHCPTSVMLGIARGWCGHPAAGGEPAEASKPLVEGGMTQLLRDTKARFGEDADDLARNALRASSNTNNNDVEMSSEENVSPAQAAAAKRTLEANRMKHGLDKVVLPPVASPCHEGEILADDWSRVKAQQLLLHAAWSAYLARNTARFATDASTRWSGIDNKVCPSSEVGTSGAGAPVMSDASSFVTWLFWTVFGKGSDMLSNENWTSNGYVATLATNGKSVHTDSLQVGDLCFYGAEEGNDAAKQQPTHVAMVVGSDMVMSHGMDPIGYFKVDYKPVSQCRRYF